MTDLEDETGARATVVEAVLYITRIEAEGDQGVQLLLGHLIYDKSHLAAMPSRSTRRFRYPELPPSAEPPAYTGHDLGNAVGKGREHDIQQ